MYQHDSSLDDLLRRPMKMAINDDDYEYEYEDDEFEDEEDDLFGSDVLAAAQAEKEAEEQAAEAFAASLAGLQPEADVVEEDAEAAPEPPPEQNTRFYRYGIRRNIFAYFGLVIASLLPLTLLVIFGLSVGFSLLSTLFALGLVVGLVLSVYQFYFLYSTYNKIAVSFNVRSFFRFAPELILVSVVLLGLSFWNIGSMANGNPFSLSGRPLQSQQMSTLFEENQEETIYSSFKQAQVNKDKANNTLGGSVAAAGAQNLKNPSDYMKEPVAGAAAASIVNDMPADALPAAPQSNQVEPLRSNTPAINKFFMGGPLCAALGYAFMVGIAGLLFGLMRPFSTPFSETKEEIFDIETGEVTSNTHSKAPIMKPLDMVHRAFVGLSYGSTLGFLLGAAIILPLNLFFKGLLANDNVSPLLQTLGLSNIPDLAFTNGLTLAGIMVPLVLLIVAKMSPQGLSVSEADIQDQYVIKPTGRFVPADQLVGGNMANPAIVNFSTGMIIPDDELEAELANDRLMDELAMEDDNLTSEIIEEFGRDFESVFGIDTRELITQPKGRQHEIVDRKQLSSALDESFGELGNVPVEISAELGQATLDITEWLNLKEGTLVLLDKPADEEIDILFNGVRKGKGQLIVAEDSLAVQVSNTNFQGQNGNGSKAII